MGKICAVVAAILIFNVAVAGDGVDPRPIVDRLEALEKALGTGQGGPKGGVDVSWDSGLKLKSNDGGKLLNMNIGGRLQYDMFFVSQNDKLKTALGAAPAATNADGSKFRRLRFEMAGTAYSRLLFKLEVDFAGGAVQIREAYTGIKYGSKESNANGSFKFGSVKEPGQLDQQTSDLNLTFLERPMLIIFHADYSAGFMTDGNYKVDGTERITWGLGIFRDVGGSGDDVGAGKNGKYNWTARISGTPLYVDKGKQLIHFAVHFSLRNPNTFTGGVQSVAYSARPNTSFGPVLVNTGNVLAEKVTIFGVELGAVFNQIWFAAEYVSAGTTKPDGAAAKNASFNGFYASAGFFLTGENRPYKNAAGTWDRVKPLHNAFADDGAGGTGLGALEFAVRYDFLDLEDTSAAVYGGKLTALNAAFNWYLAPNFRYMLNFVHANLEQKLLSGAKNEGSEEILMLRFQADW